MRQASALLVVGALTGPSAVLAASLPRGVSPEFSQFYAAKGTFACIGRPDIVLSAGQVNDDSCDCPDGSDEPGTAACSHLDPLSPPLPLPGSPSGTTNTTHALPGFWCANKGHVGAYVPFSYVNDGVCDYTLCCDGSDEYAHRGGVRCENRCAAIGKEARRFETARRESLERALVRRRALAAKASELRRDVEDRLAVTQRELIRLEAEQERLEQELVDAQRADRSRVVGSGAGPKKGGKLSVLVGLARRRVDELRTTLDRVVDERDDLRERVGELEQILRGLQTQYNPNFNDEGVKAAVHGWEDYAAKTASEEGGEPAKAADDVDVYAVLKEDSADNGVNWAEFEEDETDTDILYNFQAYLPPFVNAFLTEKLVALRVWLVDNGILADNSDGSRGDSASSESAAVRRARSARDTAAAELTSKRSAARDAEADLAKDYGAGDILRALRDACLSIDVGEYEYELCWMGQAQQKSKKGHGNTGLGHFEGLTTELADDADAVAVDGKSLGSGPRTVMHYTNGQHCWNGPARRCDVWLGCAEKEEIWRVTEAEKCVYKMEVGTPIACEESSTENKGKDEL